VNCKICDSETEHLFNKIVLDKYDVSYFRCKYCGFMQTEKPYWLHEAYESPFSIVDTGLICRPLFFSKVTENIILKYYQSSARFLDYGGGNGVFVRLMRDKGYDFYRLDKYAANIYAAGFDLLDVNEADRKFELLTSVEVVEHFEDPVCGFSEMFSFTNDLLCTTLLQETSDQADMINWYYLAEFSGQHISFYTKKSMTIMAEKFDCNYYTNEFDLHLFTRKKLKGIRFSDVSGVNIIHTASNLSIKYINKFTELFLTKISRSKSESLTIKDQEYLKNKLFGRDI
jgi:hypothetical protein